MLDRSTRPDWEHGVCAVHYLSAVPGKSVTPRRLLAHPAAGVRSRRVFPSPEMRLPLMLFFVFVILSVVGAFWAVAGWRGRNAGIVAALLTLFFFGLLAAGLVFILRSGGFL